MNQDNVGEFIQTIRKDKGLTQKQLAEKVGVTDKAISKWETGKGLPEISLLMPLCEALGVNVNELLSGEKISPSEYTMKAEENIMNLLEENQMNKKSGTVQTIVGVLLAVVGLVFIFAGFAQSFTTIFWFIDIPSILMLAIFCASIVLLSKAKTKKDIVNVLQKSSIPVGVFITLVGGVFLLGSLSNPETIGPNLAVCMLSMLYAILLYIVLIPIKARIN